jgi:hypothetical protein
MGVSGKKPQNTLTNEEAEKVKVRLGLSSSPPPQVGKERLVVERIVVQAVVYQGRVTSLRRFKDDVREVLAGYECGVGLEHYQDLKARDVVEAFEVEQVTRRLEPRPHPAPIRLFA